MQSEQVKPKSLAAKIAEVVQEVSHVEKRGHNDFHNYDYATAADVLEAVRKGLASRNVVIVPRVTGSSAVEKQRKDKAPELIVTADMVLTVLDGDSGEAWECAWKGCGQDSGDKGIYKALTGGYKYFLLQLFMIPTGDDPEKDTRKRKDVSATAGPMSDEDSAILMIAGQLADLTPGKKAADHIEEASTFVSEKDKKKVPGFRDPTKVKPGRWKSMTKANLEKALHAAQLKAEPGVQEMAALFEGSVK